MNLGLYVNLLALSGTAVKLLAWGMSMWNDRSREFRCVRIWLGMLAAEDVILFSALKYLGLRSFWYARLYYGIDVLTILCGLFVLLRMAELAFHGSHSFLPLLRKGALMALIGLILISVAGMPSHWTASATSRTHFVVFAQSLEQNMNVAGMLAAMILWGSINALAIPGVRVRRITAAISISYSTGAFSWSFYSLFRHYELVMTAISFVSTISIFLIGWTLAFEKEAAVDTGEFSTTKPLATGAASGWAGGR